MNVKREEECYDASTDDEGCRPMQMAAVVVKKEEDVDTDDEFQVSAEATSAPRKSLARVLRKKSLARRNLLAKERAEKDEEAKRVRKFYEERSLAEKEEASRAKALRDEAKRGLQLAKEAREAEQRRAKRKLTAEDVASLDDLGFEIKKEKSFQKRLDALRAYKAKHGHSRRDDKSLCQFCWKLRQAYRGRGTMKLAEDRIASLDALGFTWAVKERSSPKSFEERIEELTEYKAEHGHLKVKVNQDKSLAKFCVKIRQARKGRGTMKVTKDRIASLDALGFEWAPKSRQPKTRR